MRIAIEARGLHESSGGVLQVALGLASGLSQLDSGDDEFVFFISAAEAHRFSPLLSGPCRAVPVPDAEATDAPSRKPGRWRESLPTSVRRTLRRAKEKITPSRTFTLPVSDGLVEQHGCQLVHFPHQAASITSLPSIYHPHDLQHLHLPQYFAKHEIDYREFAYPAFCRQAVIVAVASSWVKADLIRAYGLRSDKIAVIPLAPLNESEQSLERKPPEDFGIRHNLPEAFLFYPAQTWQHKNHDGLLRALAWLRARGRGLEIKVVFSGYQNDFFPHLSRLADKLNLRNAVTFVGFVSGPELAHLYRLAKGVIIPSKFEAASFPLWEAFKAGVPTACSTVTSLPAQAGDAAILFDPNSVSEIATAMESLWNDEELRRRLRDRGRQSVARFSWRLTATHFRARYRAILGAPLTDNDQLLLREPPIL